MKMMDRAGRLGRLFYLVSAPVISAALAIAMATCGSAPVAWATGPATTLVMDTIYRADGSPAQGTLVITWTAFTTSENKPVAAGTLSLAIATNGAISAQLAPNEGATPEGSYYKVVYKLSDGTTATEYWVVPAASPATVSGVRASVVPASVAA